MNRFAFTLLTALLAGNAAQPLLAGESEPPVTTDEYQLALTLTPDLNRGRLLYLNCVSCHGPEGWGKTNGTYPQIAGQLAGVIIKQLEDIRQGNRSNPIMRAFTSPRVLAGAQEIADVAAYVAALPMSPSNGQGRTRTIAEGKAIYEEYCQDCHGKNAEGDPKEQVPLLYGQHYRYLKRQFDHIRRGLRKNADEEMTKQIMEFDRDREIAVLSYTASLRPPPEKVAPPGWRNLDFPQFQPPPFLR